MMLEGDDEEEAEDGDDDGGGDDDGFSCVDTIRCYEPLVRCGGQ